MASVDTNNSKLQEYEQTKNSLINEAQSNYNNVLNGAEQKYNELIQASKDYGEQQKEITQAKTDQTIKEINQNKEQAEKDYIKEQKASYANYAKQVNDYGTNAEIQASAGLQGSGYSESSKVSMYNTYQNRYTTAREIYNQAVLNYNNQISQAQLQNSALLAEIAYNSLQTQLQLALEGFQYKNDLLNNLLNQKININSTYENLWQSQYNTLLNEAEFNEQMAHQREQFEYQKQMEREQFEYQKQRDAIADAQWQAQYNLSKASASRSSSGGSSGGSSRLTNSSSVGTTLKSGGSSNVSQTDSLYKTIKSSEPTSTDNMAGQIQHRKWEENSIKLIQESKGLESNEKTELMVKLNLGL